MARYSWGLAVAYHILEAVEMDLVWGEECEEDNVISKPKEKEENGSGPDVF